jgi:hypothetical protein
MRTLLIVISILSVWGTEVPARAEVLNGGGNTSESERVSQTWQILDYLADDYRGAVNNGQILSAYAPYGSAGEARWQQDSALRARIPDLGTLVRGREDQWAPIFGAARS